MKFPRLIAGSIALCAFVGAVVAYARVPAHGFDLQGAPVLVRRPAADITDAYLFPSPTNANNVVAVMDVYPLIPASANAGTALNRFFDQGVLYTMKFDNQYGQESAAAGARPVENVALQFSFGAPSGDTQQAFVYGPATPVTTGASSRLLNGGSYNATGFINRAFSFGVGTNLVNVFVGARRDPSFFSAAQFFNIFPNRNQGSTQSTCLPSGTNTCPQGFNSNTPSPPIDAFANTDVLAIVVEFPKTLIAGTGPGVVAYWATTSTSNGQ